jgi:hypothetical protein
MATPGQLVQAMAGVLGIPATTVSQYDRQLAEAGLRTTGGRGTSAAKVTATDAANLLIAILGSPVSGASISAARQICKSLGSLPASAYSTKAKRFGKFGFQTLATLPPTHTFREAVAKLIEGASRGEPFDGGTLEVLGRGKIFDLKVENPILSATLTFNFNPGLRFRQSLYFTLKYDCPTGRVKIIDPPKFDLVQERRITYRTLGKLGGLLEVGREQA